MLEAYCYYNKTHCLQAKVKMDRRSWPWKKKTSEKVVTPADSVGSSLASSAGNQGDQVYFKQCSKI